MDVPIERSESVKPKWASPSIPIDTPFPHELFTSLEFLEKISGLGGFEENTQNLYAKSGVSGATINFGDSVNEYRLNSLGYRSSEFKKVPLVFAGCSVTFGVGVPFEGIWSTLVGEKLGLEHINLSAPGWSIQRIVDSLFKYFYEYGNPETLFVVFPNYYRLILTSHREFSRVDTHFESEPLLKVQDTQFDGTPVVSRSKYSKKPHDLKQFITPEYALSESFRSINSLITYCKRFNIKFVWSTWDIETHEIIDIVKNRWNKESYRGYVYSKYSFNGNLNKNEYVITDYSDCHSGYISKYKDTFFRGEDKPANNDGSVHPGVHYHLHLSEAMLEGLENFK